MSKMGQHVLEMHESQDVIHVAIDLSECYSIPEALLMMEMETSPDGEAFVKEVGPCLSLWVGRWDKSCNLFSGDVTIEGEFYSFIVFTKDFDREPMLIDTSSRVRDLI